MTLTTPAVITIGIDPEFQIGPLTLAWHGITIAIGIVLGGMIASRVLREWGLDTEPMYTIGTLAAVGGIVGGKLFYAVERGDAGSLISSRGFTFDGGVLLAAILVAVYVRRESLRWAYLDATALGLAFGTAIGRIGDVINGEHYGDRSDFFLAVRNSNPNAGTPDPNLAYHSGGLYEVLLAALIFAIAWPLRHRLKEPLMLMWLVIGLFGIGRFFEFFLRSDSEDLALGLSTAQWSSVVMLLIAVVGAARARRRPASAGSRATA